MKRRKLFFSFMVVLLMFSMIFSMGASAADKANGNNKGLVFRDKITAAERQVAADALQAQMEGMATAVDLVTDPNTGYPVPDYFGVANWAYSPPLSKFINALPVLGNANPNENGQYIPVAIPDQTKYPDSDYYEIAVVEYEEIMHSELPPTTNRGYVQLSTPEIRGRAFPLTYLDGTPILKHDGTPALAVDEPHYLGPAIVSESNKPVRIKFYNLLPTGVDGDLFIPTDTTVMGSGMGENPMESYTQNRANVHLHGNNTVWISDGTPHQWITPADEVTSYPQGVSVVDVPDMEQGSVVAPDDGMTTLFYTNAQSARLMFYHDHSYGITRLNVYAGVAAPYIIRDKVESDLMGITSNTTVNPNNLPLLPNGESEIPLVIQDRTFVDAATVMATDPTWSWGTNKYVEGQPYVPTTGDLWYPHVYSPAQNPWAPDGINPFGRWMYGPWFWPPTDITYDPVPNPYYVSDIDTPWQPPMIPGTPNPSAPGESFMDTPMVNGTAYPYLEVDPMAYRFRILNAANDRFFNLQMYVADDTYLPGEAGHKTEVKMIPVSLDNPAPLPSHREQIIPDPATQGPDWIQVGTEGGFLPAPVVIPSQPITWNLGLTAFNAGNIDQHSLLLGTAERADVIVDFSQYAGQTLILYNDAPAPFPASDTRYDYYTNNADLTTEGGAPSTALGKGPNIRTIMQIRVADIAPEAPYNLTALEAAFAKTATKPGVFEQSHDPIIIPQEAYNSAYGVTDLPADPAKAYVQLHEFSKTFSPIIAAGEKPYSATLNIEPKAMQDEMGEVYDAYGRMSGFLGLTSPVASSVVAPFIPYGFASPPVDLIQGVADLEATQIGDPLEDGTQIWKITHNGVDTHPIHTHLFTAQLVNRVAWDGAMIPPDPNELGWKETFRVNPLEHTIIAMRPNIPTAEQVPFDIPNSVRLIDPTKPEGAVLDEPPPAGWFDPQGNPVAQILNHEVNFGWEYVYHCHILSHEEMDMMHVMSFVVPPKAPTQLSAVMTGSGNRKNVILNWVDQSINETSFIVQRSGTQEGPWDNLATLQPDATSYTVAVGRGDTLYHYRVVSANTVGDTATAGFPMITKQASSDVVSAGIGSTTDTIPLAPTTLTATLQPGPQVLLTWRDNAINETGYAVMRSTNGGPDSQLIILAGGKNTGNLSFVDTTAMTGNTYAYHVLAVNSAGRSLPSNLASVSVPSIPTAPSNIFLQVVLKGNKAQVKMDWTDNATNETGFIIQWTTDPNFILGIVSANVGADAETYTTTTLSRGTQYYFRIRAGNSVGQSNWAPVSPLSIFIP